MKDYLNAPYKELEIGMLIHEPGNAEEYDTASWTTFIPEFDAEKCTNCFICWVVCPDSSILVKDGKVVGIDTYHCKGCGLCVAECPPKANALKMVKK